MKRLLELRKEKQLSQREVAQALQIHPHTYASYESGKHRIPLDTLVKLAIFFDTSVDYILELTDAQEYHRRSGK